METRFHRLCVCFQVILAYESMVLCMCSGNVLIAYFIFYTFFYYFNAIRVTNSMNLWLQLDTSLFPKCERVNITKEYRKTKIDKR